MEKPMDQRGALALRTYGLELVERTDGSELAIDPLLVRREPAYRPLIP